MHIFKTTYNPPKWLSPPHPDAVGTLADTWIPWIESDGGIVLREWQKVVLRRALQVDASGKLLIKRIVVATPRQVGKSWLIRALASARCHHADHFGEPQEIAHIANNVAAARRIHQKSWRWAKDAGVQVYKAFGYERMIWDDGSAWSLISLPSVWGMTSTTSLLDECWDITEDAVTSAIWPTLVASVQPQLWMFSTANEAATPLMPSHIRLAMEGSDPSVVLALWGADPEDDPDDSETWRKASPYWDEQRYEFMSAARSAKHFRQQWLGVWDMGTIETASWLPGWESLGAASGDTGGGVGSIEASTDRGLYGASVCIRRDDGSVDAWTTTEKRLEDALEWLEERGPVVVLAGLSIKDEVVGTFEVRGVGAKETRTATPFLIDAVRRDAVRHDHDPETAKQVAVARTTDVEAGLMLSAKRSGGPIPAVKALCWAVWAASTMPVEPPEIW